MGGVFFLLKLRDSKPSEHAGKINLRNILIYTALAARLLARCCGTWAWPPQRSVIVYGYSISGDYPGFRITHENDDKPLFIFLYIYVCVCVSPRSTQTIFLMVSSIAFSIPVEISLPCGTVQKVSASSHKSIPGWTTLCWTVIISVRPALYPKNHNSLCHWRKAMVRKNQRVCWSSSSSPHSC